MRKFDDSIKAHLLIPQLVARGYPLEILVLGTLTHKSPRCLEVGNSCSNIIMGCASSILAGCLQSCSWARDLLFEFVQALGYVVLGSVCEEHIDDLSHFVTNKSRMQLFQDSAKIGRAVKVGTAELGLTLSCKSTLLANDKSLGKLIVSHLGLTESLFVWGQQPLIWGSKRLRGKGYVPQVSGNAYGKAGEGPRESIVCARRTLRRKSSR